MQRVGDSLAALNDAIHVQALSQAALERRQAELHTALNALGANLPAPTLERLLVEVPNPPQWGRPTPPDDLLFAQGFIRNRHATFEWGLLHADLWARNP